MMGVKLHILQCQLCHVAIFVYDCSKHKNNLFKP
jgi:hypothetical protein